MLRQVDFSKAHIEGEADDAPLTADTAITSDSIFKLWKTEELLISKVFLSLGPEPLEDAFTYKVFKERLQNKRGKIKQVLMDNKVVVGIGNIYSDEILFHACVRPTRAVSTLTDKKLSAIYKWIKPVLEKGIKAKGSSVGDFVRTDGTWGQMGKFHFVYGRKGKECKKCGSIIEVVKLGGRTGSYCPNCQK